MKHLISAALALLVGLILGGILPRGELRDLRRELAENSPKRCEESIGPELAAMFQAGRHEEASEPPPPVEVEAETPELDPEEDHYSLDEAGAEPLGAEEDTTEPGEDLDMARDALDLRRAQAREALIQGADPDEEQLATIDAAFERMNKELIGLADELTDMLADGEQPSRRDAMSFAADALDSMLAADEAVQQALTSEQVADLEDSAVDPFSYLDPAIIDVLEAI